MADTILEMRGITKAFPGVVALKNVNFKVRRGEIHCLVGENGAGKSTLMKVLSGVYQYGNYEGDILYNGKVQQFKGIADSEKQGIAVIYQELALIPELSIYENIYFGHEIMRGRVIDWNETVVMARQMLKKVRFEIDPSTKVKNLGVGHQQLVEIAKALSKNVELLILDEPTAALNEDDSRNLLELMQELKTQGVTCIMISHKLKEVIAVADTITVLRDGATICSMDTAETKVSEADIIRHMVGREIDNIYPPRPGRQVGDVVFEVEGWTVEDPASGREILHDVTLNVRRGEIVGLQGLMGAGRTEFAMSVFGNPAGYKIKAGQLAVGGRPACFKSPREAIKAGLAYVSEDRKGNGLVLIQDIRYNITLANLDAITDGIAVNSNEEIKRTEEYRKSINIKCTSILQQVMQLSGGNQQKVQIGKWMFARPNLLILDEPTRGIDVGAKYEIYTLMNQLVEEGTSIIMISSELPEILGMSDRLYVMSAGSITGELTAGEATEEKVMALAVKA